MTVKDRARDLRLRRTFHITLEEYNRVLCHQNGRCAICKRPAYDFKTRLAVDHRHSDGLLRGLLCYLCNRRWFRDVPQLHLNAAAYLLSPPLVAALGSTRFTAPGEVGTKKRAKLLKILKKGVNGFKSYTSQICTK